MAISREARLVTLLVIDSLFFFLEITVGYASDSLALIADALHMLNDVMSLVVALYALKLSNRSRDTRDPRYSYGWQRAEILGALINGVFLLALCFTIFMEALQRLVDVSEVKNPRLVIVVGAFGLASNIVGLFLFHDHGHAHGGHSHGGHGHSHAHAPTPIQNSDTSPAAEGDVKMDGSSPAVPTAVRPQTVQRGESSSSVVVDDAYARERGGSVSSLFGHPAQQRAFVVQKAQDLGYEDGRRTSGGIAIAGGERDTFGRDADQDAAIDVEAARASHDHDGSGKGKKRGLLGRVFGGGAEGSHDGDHGHGHGHDHGNGQAAHAHAHTHGGHSHGHSHGADGSMNMQGVFLHVLGDALGNVGVIVAGCFIAFTTYSWRFYSDPVVSFVITVIIFHSALPLVKSASFILLQGVPHTVPFEEVREAILDVDGVLSAHDLHVWALSESKIVASVHVLVNCGPGQDERYMGIAAEIRARLHTYSIHSVTIQPEFIRGGIKEAARLSGVAATDQRDADGKLVTSDGVPVEEEVSRIETACLITCGPDASCASEACCPPPSGAVTPSNGNSDLPALRSIPEVPGGSRSGGDQHHSAQGEGHDGHDHDHERDHETDALLGGRGAADAQPRQNGLVARLKRGFAFGGGATRGGLDADGDASAGPGNRRRTTLAHRFADFKAKHPYVLGGLIGVALLVLLGVISLAVAGAHLLTVTLRAPSADVQARIVDESLLLKGPDRVSLLNITDEGVTVRVDGRLGIDPERALDLWLGKRKRVGWWESRERSLVEWAVGKVGGVRVELGELTIVEPDWSLDLDETKLDILGDVRGRRSGGGGDGGRRENDSHPQPPRDLLSFHIEPLFVPLPALSRSDADKLAPVPDPPVLGNHSTDRALRELRPVNLTLLLRPAAPVPYLLEFAKRATKHGRGVVDVRVPELRVRGLDRADVERGETTTAPRWSSFASWINVGATDLRKRLSQKIPKFDNSTDLGEMLNLTRYDFFEIKGVDDAGATASRALGIRAFAEAKNPLGKVLHGRVRYNLPFGAYLPVGKVEKGHVKEASLLAAVATEPFELTGQKKVPLVLEGRVVRPAEEDLPKPDAAPEAPATTSSYSASAQGQSVFSREGLLDSVVRRLGELRRDQAEAGVRSQTPAQQALSDFLSRFLRGEANTIFVRGGSPTGVNASAGDQDDIGLPGGGSELPEWLEAGLRSLDLPISFPGSRVTDLIKNVTISNLKIVPHPFEREKLLCSGTVLGEMNLPGQLAAVDVSITHLWPDILVFDGKPPSLSKPGRGDGGGGGGGGGGNDDDDDGGGNDDDRLGARKVDDDDDDDAPPLPDPLPKHAFGRVRPHNWTAAETYVDPTDPLGQRKLLRAELRDVPFTVLPGRGSNFRSYTWRLLSGKGVLTGIEGKARALIWNSGLGNLELSNLPVKGAFLVGKRGGGGGGDDGPGDPDGGADPWGGWSSGLDRWIEAGRRWEREAAAAGESGERARPRAP